MKSKIHLITLTILFVFGTSCNSQKKITKKAISTEDNSMTSVDWDGTYQGILPCADCEGIKTEIVLNNDLSYLLETSYIGKNEKIFVSKGYFHWDKSGSKITLDNSENEMYQVAENKLFRLDKSGNQITGDLAGKYILEKERIELAEKYWELIELNGHAIKVENREPFIKFNQEEMSVNGNNSCNSFNGKYEISEGNKIKFSPFMMTRMACIDNSIESEFMQSLEVVTSYKLIENKLILIDTNNKQLAKFESDFFN